MNRMWDILMRPIIEAIGASYIVEVGSEKGTSTQNILEYCVENDAHMVAIDPFPQFDVDEFKEEYGDRFEIFSELSLSSLPLLKDYDVILIDGDHNWYTVYNELKIIERTFENKKFPLVFLHDVGWPYGRRDLYYDPDNIPAVYRQPYKKLGMYPGKAYLLEEGGLNRGYCNSIYQNNLRNGVLTAVEDFVKESELEFSFEHIDLYHGLGILHLKDNELETIIKEVIKSANLLNKVEEERIKLQIEYTQSKKNLISLENQLKKSQEQNANFKRLEDDYEVSKNYNKSLENKIKEAKLVLKPTTDQLELLFNYAKLKQGIIRDMGEREVELRSQVDDLVFELYEMDYNSNKSFFSRFPSLYILFSGIKNDRSLRNIFANIKGYRAIKENDLFDVGYYLKNNSDVRSSYRDPLIHYIFNGFKEGRKPGPSFNGDFYLRKHADVRESNLNPLVHYSLYGIKENRKTMENQNEKKIEDVQLNRDYRVIINSGFFDVDWYIKNNKDINFSIVDPISHYLERGAEEGRDPNPFFDTDWYIKKYSDVAKAKVNPLVHFIDHGEVEGRSPNPFFDPLDNVEFLKDFGEGLVYYPFSIDDFKIKGVKTLFFSHNLKTQGAQKSLYELVIGLKNRELVNPIIYSPTDGPLKKAYEKNGVKVIVGNGILDKPLRLSEFNKSIFSLIRKLEKYQIQFIHCNTLRTFYGVEIAKKMKIKCSWNIRESEDWNTYFNYLPEEVKEVALKCFNYPEKVIFVSDYTKEIWDHLSNDNFITIHNALNTENLMYDSSNWSREEARVALGIKGDEIVIIQVGTISERKGQKDLLFAINEFPLEIIKNIKIFIIGDSPSEYSDEVHVLHSKMPQEYKNSVQIIPETSSAKEFFKVIDYYLAADIFVFSSRIESYPRVILESLHFSLPIITTPVFGVKEQLDDECALFYEPGDIKQLSNQLLKLIKNDNLRYKLRTNSMKQLEKLSTYDEMLEKYGNIFENI